MNFSPKVQPVQEKINYQSKNLKNLFSGTNQFPPGLDELQPKSPASPGGNKLSIQKSKKVLFSGINKFPPGLDRLQPKSLASPGGNKLSNNQRMEFFLDDDERYEKCIYSINRGIAAQQFHHFWSKIHVLMIYGKNGGNMLVSSCVL